MKIPIITLLLMSVSMTVNANTVTLYKVGNNAVTTTINESDVLSYVQNYEWSIEPTTLMYSKEGLSSWICNSEIDIYKELGWSVTPQAVFTYNVFQKSNLTVEQLNKILLETGLEGYGQIFYNMEQTYNINSLFAVAVGCHESGNFYKTANTYNYFGFRGNKGWLKFNSPDECINYFGKLMNNKLYYGKSIDQIAVKYCNSSWAGYVKNQMYQKWQKIIS